MILEGIIEFLRKCPYIKNGTLCADYLTSKAENYAIEAVPSTVVLKTYSDGSSLNQFSFVFASRQYLNNEKTKENHTFFENLSEWFSKCTKEKNLPYIGDKMTSQSIETQSSGYMYEGNANTARYQVQCRLIYYKEA